MCNLDDIDDPFQLSLVILSSLVVDDDDTGAVAAAGAGVPTTWTTASHAEITFPVSQSGSFEFSKL